MAKALLSTMLLIILILAACSEPAPTEIPTTAPEPKETTAPAASPKSEPTPTATATPAPTQPPAQPSNLWRGITIAPENRCSPYDSDEYRYSPSVEPRIVEAQGGIYGPYTGTWFESIKETQTSSTSSPAPKPTTAASVRPGQQPGRSSHPTS